ncbi:ribonuclease H2 subunit A-like isoform X2 [Pollicipes pollicipes]|nr:ribonuclease H2 subunit A-like isoform X2 [Pollicipes pollicipes]XP_037073615.1 ribonuclease H2 subunit A-like isoform X2 [Pollicipes pollicipes]XP_037073616.1 ribonuclease H2 subunit A-like isoform X2 [Pollicipes pollicipes]XP_037073617.1 ribonuclease H2 subunit A-like isoform X2 [Pollicipes pollicipes]XP_037073618.1 ribonuclease H2 subunit A-like isoform X2 [Pollicipes pollicipes]XP_037073619.1 ribonuclease H2 subunit A-like isoform X2 [Pollicipes pollicipes]XP_037073621.1 ribonuclease H
MDLDAKIKEFSDGKNTATHIISSAVPDICKSEPCMLGIDEAGRGPVLGPMVYGCAYCPVSKLAELKALKCADSKTLSLEAREKLLILLNDSGDFLGWEVEILSPSFISRNMFKRSKYNLNWMSHDAAIALIARCREAGVNVTEVYVDTVGPPEKYQAKLEARFPGLKITVSKKADALFPTVSAASICAKVVRDRALAHWTCPEKMEVDVAALGSGYPADPQTKRFLASSLDPVFGFPSLVRFSWSTCQTILDTSAVGVQWEKPDDENAAARDTPSVAALFGGQGARHVFFTERHLRPAPPL